MVVVRRIVPNRLTSAERVKYRVHRVGALMLITGKTPQLLKATVSRHQDSVRKGEVIGGQVFLRGADAARFRSRRPKVSEAVIVPGKLRARLEPFLWNDLEDYHELFYTLDQGQIEVEIVERQLT